MTVRAIAPSRPPARPFGAMKCRSPRWVRRTSPCRISYSRKAPRPPRCAPAPPESRRDAMDPDRSIELERLGRQVHAVCGVGLDHVGPILPGARPGAASDQLAGYVVSAVAPHAAEGKHEQLPAAIGRHAIGNGLGKRR